jgi:hypothetical protein
MPIFMCRNGVKILFRYKVIKICVIFSPLPFSPRLNSAGGFCVRVLISPFSPRVNSAESGLGGVGGGLGSLWQAFPQTQKFFF